MDKSRRSIMLSIGAGVGTALFAGMPGAALGKPKAREKVIKVVAKKFEYTPNRIVLKKNQAVVLEITALDFTHGFKIPDWNIRADLVPGQVVKCVCYQRLPVTMTFFATTFAAPGTRK